MNLSPYKYDMFMPDFLPSLSLLDDKLSLLDILYLKSFICKHIT